MHFTKLVPNVFYTNIHDALKLFVDCLEFNIAHDEMASENPFCVLEKDGLRINIFENKALAKEHHPEFRLVTNDIQEAYQKISVSHPEFLHPNLNNITPSPLGSQRICSDGQTSGHCCSAMVNETISKCVVNLKLQDTFT